MTQPKKPDPLELSPKAAQLIKRFLESVEELADRTGELDERLQRIEQLAAKFENASGVGGLLGKLIGGR